MKLYVCELCNKHFKKKCHLINHHNRKYKCVNPVVEIFTINDVLTDKKIDAQTVQVKKINHDELISELISVAKDDLKDDPILDQDQELGTKLDQDQELGNIIQKLDTINEPLIDLNNEPNYNEVKESKKVEQIESKKVEITEPKKVEQIESKKVEIIEPKKVEQIESKKVEIIEPKLEQIQTKNEPIKEIIETHKRSGITEPHKRSGIKEQIKNPNEEHISVAKENEKYKKEINVLHEAIKKHISNNQIKDEYSNRNVNIPIELLNQFDDGIKPIVKILLKKCIIEKLDENTFQTLLYNYLTRDIYHDKIKIHDDEKINNFFIEDIENNIISVAEHNTNQKHRPNKSEKNKHKRQGTSKSNKTLKNPHILVKKIT